MRDVDLDSGPPPDLEALPAARCHPAPVTALVRCVHPAGAGDHATQIDQLAELGERAGLILEARGHAHRAGVEPLDQMRTHGLRLVVGWRAGLPTHGGDLDGEVRRLRYEVVWDAALEYAQVARN